MTPKGSHAPTEDELSRETAATGGSCPAGLDERITRALGGPVEGCSAERIAERHAGRVHGIVGPREAGVGDIVNCGAAMYMAPVGPVTAADPAAAHAEALDIAGAHQPSYGREAAGVLAAAAPPATADPVGACLSPAKDGTRKAIEKVREVAARHRDFESAPRPPRAAVAPYDTAGPDDRAPSLAARRPSRLHAIEELPVAGALGSPVPQEWAKTVAGAGRLDLWAPARALTEVTREVLAAGLRRRRAHERAFAALGGTACSD